MENDFDSTQILYAAALKVALCWLFFMLLLSLLLLFFFLNYL